MNPLLSNSLSVNDAATEESTGLGALLRETKKRHKASLSDLSPDGHWLAEPASGQCRGGKSIHQPGERDRSGAARCSAECA